MKFISINGYGTQYSTKDTGYIEFPKIRQICEIRVSSRFKRYEHNITSARTFKKCYTFRQIIFFHNGEMRKKVYKPLRSLCFSQIAVTY